MPDRLSDKFTDEHWRALRRLFEGGESYQSCEDMARTIAPEGVRSPSLATIRRRAISEGWVKNSVAINAPSPKKIEQIKVATETKKLTAAEKLVDMADDLVLKAQRLLDQAFQPAVRREVKLIGRGQGISEAEIIDVDMAEPSPSDKQRLITSAAILIDKAQLLTGGATERTETVSTREQAEGRIKQLRDELADRRAAKTAQDALADKA